MWKTKVNLEENPRNNTFCKSNIPPQAPLHVVLNLLPLTRLDRFQLSKKGDEQTAFFNIFIAKYSRKTFIFESHRRLCRTVALLGQRREMEKYKKNRCERHLVGRSCSGREYREPFIQGERRGDRSHQSGFVDEDASLPLRGEALKQLRRFLRPSNSRDGRGNPALGSGKPHASPASLRKRKAELDD
ncbi:hypothetical protein AOLI_G00071510 [Acnodon oligacanthus]